MLNQIKIYLLNSKVIVLILSFGLFLLFYAALVILHKKIKKTKFYSIVFINKLVDSLDGWIFFIAFDLYLLYIFSFIFIYPKFFKVLAIILILILGFIVSKFLGRILQYYASNIDKTISSSLIINLVNLIIISTRLFRYNSYSSINKFRNSWFSIRFSFTIYFI
jgi:hypothetical protein